MATDRELLVAAANAAGMTRLEIAESYSKGYKVRDGSGDGWYLWNPLTDDGDALRLAVKLDMTIVVESGCVDVNVWSSAYFVDHGGDKCAATRRAIVRAAAAIGGLS